MTQDPLAQDKIALRKSQAGMRFIAQMTIYNTSNWERLDQFIKDSYHADILEEQSAESRLQVFKTTFEKIGRMRVKQVIATNEHHSVIAMETEKGGAFFYIEVRVEEDYPHKITFYLHQPLQPVQPSGDEA